MNPAIKKDSRKDLAGAGHLAKLVLITIIGVVVLCIAGVWYNKTVEESKSNQAAAIARIHEAFRDHRVHSPDWLGAQGAVYTICNNPEASAYDCEHIKDLQVHLVELYIGPTAADSVKICYGAGYPVNEHPEQNGLSRRKVAECDSILNRVWKSEIRDAAEEAKKDAAYDKKHPVK